MGEKCTDSKVFRYFLSPRQRCFTIFQQFPTLPSTGRGHVWPTSAVTVAAVSRQVTLVSCVFYPARVKSSGPGHLEALTQYCFWTYKAHFLRKCSFPPHTKLSYRQSMPILQKRNKHTWRTAWVSWKDTWILRLAYRCPENYEKMFS